MVVQDTFGEFDARRGLRGLVEFICKLSGTYEVLIRAADGREGVIHCSGGNIRNATHANLSGLDALKEIFSWERGRYWLEELADLPAQTVDIPLAEALGEIAEILPATEPSVKPAREPVPKPQPRPARVDTTAKSVTGLVNEDALAELCEKINAIPGVAGVMVVSQDGVLLAWQGRQRNNQDAQMLAILGEAFEETGELAGKGRLLHGAVELDNERLLIHPLRETCVGTIIGYDVSAQLVGIQVERIIGRAGRK